MNIKRCSTKEILAKIYNDFQPSNSAWVASAHDWIGEAVQGIGFHANSVTKVEDVCIANHVGNLPCDIEGLIGVFYNGVRLPLGSDISGYGLIDWSKQSKKAATDEEITSLERLIKLLETQQTDYQALIDSGVLPTDPQAIEQEERINKTLTSIANLSAGFTLASNAILYDVNYYNINKTQIVTSVLEGTFKIVYWAFPTDVDGFPEIMDTFKYKEAVEWYLMYRMLLKGYKHPELKWQDCKILWEQYRQQAANEFKMSGQDDMERFKNMWTNFNFNRALWENFFIHGEQQTGLIR